MLISTIGTNEENKTPDRQSQNMLSISLYSTSFVLLVHWNRGHHNLLLDIEKRTEI